jgi:sugar lactone lactonase YvrE
VRLQNGGNEDARRRFRSEARQLHRAVNRWDADLATPELRCTLGAATRQYSGNGRKQPATIAPVTSPPTLREVTMIFVLEFALLILGILALVKGKFKLSERREVTGAAARVVGVVLILPLPLAFSAGLVIGFMEGMQGRSVMSNAMQTTLVIMEVLILAACICLALGISLSMAQPPVRELPPGLANDVAPGSDVPLAAEIPMAEPYDGVQSSPTALPLDPFRSLGRPEWSQEARQVANVEKPRRSSTALIVGSVLAFVGIIAVAGVYVVGLMLSGAEGRNNRGNGFVTPSPNPAWQAIEEQGRGEQWALEEERRQRAAILEEQARQEQERQRRLELREREQREREQREREEQRAQTPSVRLIVGDTFDMYTDAVISPDSTALIAYPGGTLKRIRLPIAKTLNTYVVAKDPYRMVLDAQRGILYAICTEPRTGKAARRDRERRGLYGKGDLYVFDVSAVLKGDLPDGSRLTPRQTVPVGGTVSTLLLSPDGAWVYFLDMDNERIGRVNTDTGQLQGVIDKLDPMTEVMCLTPDGKTLYAASHEGKFDHYNAGPYRGTVQKIDTATFTLEKSVVVNAHPQDIRATNDHLVFLSAGSGQHVGVTAVDMKTGAQKNRWCDSPGSDMLCLAPDQKTLFVSHGWHGTAHLHAVPVPNTLTDRAGRDVSINPGDNGAARREMRMSPDGKFLLCDVGRIIRVER